MRPRALRVLRSLAVTGAVVAVVVALTGGMAWFGHRAADAGPAVPEPHRGHDLVVGDHEALGDGGTARDTKEFSVR